MKLCFLMESFIIGGVENVTLRLINNILKYNDIEIVVYAQKLDGELIDCFNELVSIKNIDKLLKDDLSEFSNVIFTKGGLSRYSIFFPKYVKKIVIQHVPIILPNTPLWKNTLRVLSSFLLYRMVDKVIAVSDGINNELKNILKIKNSRTIYNPVINKDYIRKKSEEYSISDDDDYFVCVGRIHYQKNYLYLVDIINDVKKSIPNIKVFILGDGLSQDVKELKEKIKDRGLDSNIILLGNISNPFPYIKKAKSILMTSRWEGLPTVLVESIYLDTQVISVDCKYGPRELTNAGRNGYLIPCNDFNGFVQAIIKVANGKKMELPSIVDFYDDVSTKNYLRMFYEK